MGFYILLLIALLWALNGIKAEMRGPRTDYLSKFRDYKRRW